MFQQYQRKPAPTRRPGVLSANQADEEILRIYQAQLVARGQVNYASQLDDQLQCAAQLEARGQAQDAPELIRDFATEQSANQGAKVTLVVSAEAPVAQREYSDTAPTFTTMRSTLHGLEEYSELVIILSVILLFFLLTCSFGGFVLFNFAIQWTPTALLDASTANACATHVTAYDASIAKYEADVLQHDSALAEYAAALAAHALYDLAVAENNRERQVYEDAKYFAKQAHVTSQREWEACNAKHVAYSNSWFGSEPAVCVAVEKTIAPIPMPMIQPVFVDRPVPVTAPVPVAPRDALGPDTGTIASCDTLNANMMIFFGRFFSYKTLLDRWQGFLPRLVYMTVTIAYSAASTLFGLYIALFYAVTDVTRCYPSPVRNTLPDCVEGVVYIFGAWTFPALVFYWLNRFTDTVPRKLSKIFSIFYWDYMLNVIVYYMISPMILSFTYIGHFFPRCKERAGQVKIMEMDLLGPALWIFHFFWKIYEQYWLTIPGNYTFKMPLTRWTRR